MSDTPLRDLEDYRAKRRVLEDIRMAPSTKFDKQLAKEVVARMARLEQQRKELEQ